MTGKIDDLSEEAELAVCCDALLDAINGGGLKVVETSPGILREVVSDFEGKRGIAVNYCPFCGQPRPFGDFGSEMDD